MPVLTRRQFALAASLAAAAPHLALAEDAALWAAITSPNRTPAFVARDKYRHPYTLLEFFGIKPDLSVVEIEPGAGYWTEILAPYLAAHGTYRAAVPPAVPGNQREAAAAAAYLAKLKKNPALYGKVIIGPLADGQPIAPPASADLVLSFRNLHDWLADGTTTAKLAAIAAALKPGGTFGIEDHRAPTTAPQDPKAKSGYVREDYAINIIEAAGFKLTGRSNIGNNPRDTKNYPKGVWTLPPTLTLGQVDRAKYLAIGESDRWTLKFVKA